MSWLGEQWDDIKKHTPRKWVTHGLKDVGPNIFNYRQGFGGGKGSTNQPQAQNTDFDAMNKYALEHAGPIAGPMAPFRQTPGLVMQPGVNPFMSAANAAGMNVAPTMASQTAMASALRGATNGTV